MSIDGPMKRLHDYLSMTAHGAIECVYDASIGNAESPIERYMFTAIMTIGSFGPFAVRLIASPESLQEELVVLLEPQKKIGKYRADFCLTVWDGQKLNKLIVECDGHDFHERTKEQAARDKARDRHFTMGGYSILRFTGSEIFKNPGACGQQVFDWCEKHLLTAWKAR